ncbi:MAG: xanthine dehydrogenase family protein subunit M [Alphaproteobacteria bacterium]|nr:xanthine dehydrogenase family protein subunit M [Alphaproteobacteria bacterium]
MATRGGYHRPSTLPEALAILGEGEGIKPISGGASLVAMMNAGIVEPTALVSLEGIDGLAGLSSVDGGIRIGAFTRHRDIAETALLTGTSSVVADAARQIGNAVVRNMGTIGGAVAHADPGLDFPPALVAAGASVEIASPTGSRRVAAGAFFVDWYTTRLAPGELVIAIHLPKPEPGIGLYLKHSRVAGDFAIASVAATLARSGRVRVAIGGCGPTPIASEEADEIMSARRSKEALERAGGILSALADPIDDVRGSAEYRRMLIPRLLTQAMNDLSTRLGQ